MIPLLLAVGATTALQVWVVRVPPGPEEPLFLLWARVAAQHPLRTPFAIFLVALGFWWPDSARAGLAPNSEVPAREGGEYKLD